MDVTFGTENPAKAASIKPLIKGTGINIIPLYEYERPQIREDGETLKDNAIAKAKAAFNWRGGFTIAEDTGLYIDKLAGLPGISPTRWTGKKAPAKVTEKKLLDLMKTVERSEHRTATFKSVVAVVRPDGKTRTFSGELRGHIVKRPRGYHMVSGFPYDRIFMPESEGKVLAEIGFDHRAAISHRGQAMLQALAYIDTVQHEFV